MSTITEPTDPAEPTQPSLAATWATAGVPLPPLGNEHIVGVASGRLLDATQCRAVLDALDAAGDDPPAGPTTTEANPVPAAALPGRLLPPDIDQWLLPMIGQAVTVANNQHFRFELTGILATDPPVVVRLGPDDRGLSEHLFTDLLPVASTRKLTVVLPLGEGTGGVPEFPALEKTGGDSPGELSIFPSYLSYRLLPVSGAPRAVLWTRVHGPHFQ